MSGLKLAKVIRVVPGARAVDLLFLDDGSRVPAVQVMTPCGSTDSGSNFMINPSGGGKWDAKLTGSRDVIAVVGFYRGLPVVIGFLYPQVCQMLFDRQDFKVDRHPSDVYSTIDADGNVEVFHPSGTYLRIGENPAHEDLTGQDTDGAWAISKNTGKAVHVQLTIKNAGATKASLNIDPSGNVTLEHEGNFTHHVKGNYTLSVDGSYTANVTGAYVLRSVTYDWNP